VIVRQAAHVRIVLAKSLLHHRRHPGLVGQSAGQIPANVERERRAADFSVAAEQSGCRLALIDHRRVPDAGKVGLPVGKTGRGSFQIRFSLRRSRYA